MEPGGVVQTLGDMNKVRLIAWCKQGLLYAASVSQVWGLVAVDVAKQRKVLLDNKQFQLALKLTVKMFILLVNPHLSCNFYTEYIN